MGWKHRCEAVMTVVGGLAEPVLVVYLESNLLVTRQLIIICWEKGGSSILWARSPSYIYALSESAILQTSAYWVSSKPSQRHAKIS